MEKVQSEIEIVHIEDESDWREVVHNYLRKECKLDGFNYTGNSSVNALRRISNIDGPCIIIMDLRLGDKSSDYGGYFWLLDELEPFIQKNPQTEIFVLSGYLNEAIIASLVRKGLLEKHIILKGKWVENRAIFAETINESLHRLQQYYHALPESRFKMNPPIKDEPPCLISILFLAADPTDTSRLRLGQEFREIQEKLKLAKLRDRFRLELPQFSTRPEDFSQALLDTQPSIVHFSGHGTPDGSIYMESPSGKAHPVKPGALASLFEQFSRQINCVILNACYSEMQATAIVKNISYVIGTKQAIGDRAAIAFSIGFYQALGAGRTIEDAYKFGCVQINLLNTPSHLNPILLKK